MTGAVSARVEQRQRLLDTGGQPSALTDDRGQLHQCLRSSPGVLAVVQGSPYQTAGCLDAVANWPSHPGGEDGPRIASIDHVEVRRSAIVAVDDPYLAAKDADAIVVLTEWPQFREPNWTALAEQAPGAVVVDTRNVLDPAVVSDAGLIYLGNGTPSGF
jgi:hypothetical protein